MALAPHISCNHYGSSHADSDVFYNALQLGIRRCSSTIILRSLNNMHRFHWSADYERDTVLAAVAANIGTSNPLLFYHIANLPVDNSSSSSSNSNGNPPIIDWECQVAAWLKGNQSVSFDVLAFHELASSALAHENEFLPLLCRRTTDIDEYASGQLTSAINLPSKQTLIPCLVSFAYLLYARQDLLRQLLRQFVRVLSSTSINAVWPRIMRALLAELDRKLAAPILYSYTFLMLVTRDDYLIDERIGTDLMRTPPVATELALKFDVNAVMVPTSVWDITTTIGRSRGASLEEYFSKSLFTLYTQTPSPASTIWLVDTYQKRLQYHYDNQRIILDRARVSYVKKIDNQQKRLRKLIEPQRSRATVKIQNDRNTLDNFDNNRHYNYKPLYDTFKISKTLALLHKTNDHLQQLSTAASTSSTSTATTTDSELAMAIHPTDTADTVTPTDDDDVEIDIHR